MSHAAAPVFLLGSQRSGTTWLHLQLVRTGCFRFVCAADVCAADVGAADIGPGGELAVGTRGIDSIPAGPDTPEEYGLIINAGGLRYDEPDTTPQTLPLLHALLARKAQASANHRPVILKSPPDYPRGIPQLTTSFPEARFIAIQRHPLRTLQSQVRAWRKLAVHKQPYLYQVDRGYRDFMDDPKRRLQLGLKMHTRAGIEWLADSILRAQLGFMALQDTWQGDNLMTIRYEDLCADQPAGFERMSDFLGMALPAPDEAPAPRDEAVTPEVADVFDERLDAFAPFLCRFGYDEVMA